LEPSYIYQSGIENNLFSQCLAVHAT